MNAAPDIQQILCDCEQGERKKHNSEVDDYSKNFKQRVINK